MRVVCDNAIPFIRPGLERLFDEADYLPGAEITHDHLTATPGQNTVTPACHTATPDHLTATPVHETGTLTHGEGARALVVRTRTRVTRELLEGTDVGIVVTATIGHDHIDAEWLRQAGIAWANCPGCNADSVGQYVQSVLLACVQAWREKYAGLAVECAGGAVGCAGGAGRWPGRDVEWKELTVAIVGHGHVGTAVERWLRELGVRIIVSDPPKGMVCDLREADVITFHTPLTRTGEHATYHIADAEFFRSLTRRPLIINAARGGVVDEEALIDALGKGLVADAVIDTWEREPDINPRLLRRALIATPHIAGYSADGKANATNMSLRALAEHFGLPCPEAVTPPDIPNRDALPSDPVARALALYDPRVDSQRLKSSPATFEAQRAHYPLRREH